MKKGEAFWLRPFFVQPNLFFAFPALALFYFFRQLF